jgi:glycosyltransferase involved in cell wall biosynthesis
MRSHSYTVVIPAFNAEQTLAAAIESVLGQSVPPAAVLVVDDGSVDRTAEIARAYEPQVRLIQQLNSGPGAATTRGFRAVTTPILACNDADDIWLVDKAARQLEWLARFCGVDAVFGRVRLFRHEVEQPANATISDNWGRTTLMMRREAALRIGPIIDPPHNCGDMIDWLARARELDLRLELMPEVLALRRIIPGSLSYDRSTRGQGYLHVAKAALDRRRGKPA